MKIPENAVDYDSLTTFKHFSGVIYHKNINVLYYVKDGLYHRDDGPAIIWSNGTKFYYKNGLRHREDGPAIIWSDGSKSYYKYGKFINCNIFISFKKTFQLRIK